MRAAATAIRHASCLVLLAAGLVLSRPAAALADPIPIESGFLSIGGAQDFFSIGFLVSVSYDLSIDGFRLGGTDVDGPRQSIGPIVTPILPVPSFFSTSGEPATLVSATGLQFAATISHVPTPFVATGDLTIADLRTGAELFNGEVVGTGLATFHFVEAPNGGQTASGVDYRFENVAATPEPMTLLLFGTALAAGATRRFHTRAKGVS